MSLRVFSLNVEHGKHEHRYPSIVREHEPDVVLLQEVLLDDVENIAKSLGLIANSYIPMAKMPDGKIWGLASYVGGDAEVLKSTVQCYVRHDLSLAVVEPPNYPTNRYLESLDVCVRGVRYALRHTHFTWCPNGQMNEIQQCDFRVLDKMLDVNRDWVLFGDMNTPRGTNPLWERLHAHRTDNIPQDIDTTLDPEYHRVDGLKRVVDVCVTQGDHIAHEVRVIAGLSDHKGVYAKIMRFDETCT